MRSLILSALAVLLSACVAGYRVGEVADKYGDPAQPTIYTMDGNAIDFSDLGFTRVSELNGLVARDRTTGKVLFTGFVLTRNTSDQEVAVGSVLKWLNIRAGDVAIFLADGERIVLTASVGKTVSQVNRSVGYPVGTDHYDYAEYHATPEQFHKIVYAQHLKFKVFGQNGTVIYPRAHRVLLDSFRRNLAQFYQDEIAGH
ncbi:MAG: hypothetical protein ACYDBA_03260 [Sulfuricaulis sp.]